jgi:hypothetical protein
MKRKPTVFISSTCYDLLQVRKNISDFVSEIGFEPLDSTTLDFPADPKVHSYEACTEAVAQADILILVIQGRYGGTVPRSGVSITTEEYRVAFHNHIPIFTFVHRTVWDLLQVWKKNPDADYSPYVDDKGVFNLIDESRKQARNNWIWTFDTAQDIVSTLKSQWAFLFAQLLQRAKTGDFYSQNSTLPAAVSAISPIMQLPSHWMSTWEYSHKGKKVKVSDDIELQQIGFYLYGNGTSISVSGPVRFDTFSYKLEGRLNSEGILEGRWQNLDPGRNYYGIFQLRASRNGRHFAGYWIGVDEKGFHTGKWHWDAK